MNPEIRFWNPHLSKFQTEVVYGEKWLRFSYENFLGRIGLWAMVQRIWFSKWYGNKMNRSNSRSKILPFIEKYNINKNEFLEEAESFKSFNHFFYRKLKPESRPINTDERSIVFPADGRHLVFPNLSETSQVYAKGQSFNLAQLFGCSNLANSYCEGSLIISRLCPVDYHRFHFPVSGNHGSPKLVNGKLFSVNPIALRKKVSIFWENKRYISVIQNNRLGKVVQILVGATCVGSVHFTATKNSSVVKGEECGYFSFGGSCVMTFFLPRVISFEKQLVKISSQGLESYAKVGEKMGWMN